MHLVESLSPLQTGDLAKRAWQEAGGGGERVPKGGAGPGLGSDVSRGRRRRLRVGAVLPGWRHSAAGQARVCQRGVAFARSPGSPSVPPAGPGEPTGPAAPGGCWRRRAASADPWSRGEGDPRESSRGAGRQFLANGVQRLLQETEKEYGAWGPFCVCVLLG